MSRKNSDIKNRIYDFMKSYMREKNFPPSMREICDGAGLKSVNTVHSYLAEMVGDGLLTSKGDGSSRTVIIKGARYSFDD